LQSRIGHDLGNLDQPIACLGNLSRSAPEIGVALDRNEPAHLLQDHPGGVFEDFIGHPPFIAQAER
jgi:hypothetical protein